MRYAIAGLGLCLLAACTPPPTTRSSLGCQFVSDCARGEQCVRGRCVAPPAQPTRCTEDTACAPNQRCSMLYGECVDGARSCTAEAECAAAGLHCNVVSGVCAQCNNNDHCAGSTICIDGFCADPLTAECSFDSECLPPRTVCTGGRCVSGCLVEGCDIGEACDTTTGRCSAAANMCQVDGDCAPPVTVCESNGCVPGCVEANNSCTGTDVCNASTGRCEPAAQTCVDDSACGPPNKVCESGVCEDGCLATGCVGTDTCDALTGRCAPALEPLGAACARDGDCVSDVCFDFGGTGGRRCVASCGSSQDCPSGFTCHSNGAAKMCVDASMFGGGATFSLAEGAACADDGDCRSGLCTNQRCVERCTVNTDCGTAWCHWDEVGAEVWDQRCNGPGGSRAVGSTCNVGSECGTGICVQGGNTTTARCLSHCDSTSDCANGTICAPVDYAICTNGSFENCNRWRVQGVKACVEDNHGNGGVGASCSRATDCRSRLCNPSLSECTDTCSTDADCPTSFGCKIDILYDIPEGPNVVPFHFNACLPRTN